MRGCSCSSWQTSRDQEALTCSVRRGVVALWCPPGRRPQRSIRRVGRNGGRETDAREFESHTPESIEIFPVQRNRRNSPMPAARGTAHSQCMVPRTSRVTTTHFTAPRPDTYSVYYKVIVEPNYNRVFLFGSITDAHLICHFPDFYLKTLTYFFKV